MVFISFSYLFLFVPIVFIVYWCFCRRSKDLQNIVLLLASIFFYSIINWKFIPLLLMSVLSTYIAANMLRNRCINNRRGG
jgi:D-alanyl-lipoteichoic acid acyltransferase DltB (MBOAT superfamily)